MTDEQARRELAYSVARVAHEAAAGVANGTLDPAAVGTAVGAVILASDLRAPARPGGVEADAWYPTREGKTR